MSVLEKIRELDAQKDALLKEAKQEAMELVHKGLKALAELGFNYSVSQNEGSGAITRAGTRRTGIREELLKLIHDNSGIGRAAILEKTGVKGDKKAEQSVSNALAALKKAGLVDNPDGGYVVQ